MRAGPRATEYKMQSKVSSPSRQTLLRLIGTVLAVILLFYLLSRQGWSEILTAVRELPPLRTQASIAGAAEAAGTRTSLAAET